MKYEDAGQVFGQIPDRFDRAMANALRGEEKPVKRKLYTSILLAALLIVALAATALAIGLRRSAEADIVAKAREALINQYGLTHETIGCFTFHAQSGGDAWTVTFSGAAWEVERLGDYTVTITPDKPPEVAWTHDGIDPTLWQSGDMDAPAWGQAQIRKRLEMDASWRRQTQEADWDNLTFEETAKLLPSVRVPTVDGGLLLYDRTVPTADDLPPDEAIRIAREAAAGTYGLDADSLSATAQNIGFGRPKEGDGAVYSIVFTRDDITYRFPSDYNSVNVNVASPSGEVTFLSWDVPPANRTLPDGPLDGYEKAVCDFMDAGALETRSATEKAGIVRRVREAGMEDLIRPDRPYTIPADGDIPQTDAIARANETLAAAYAIAPEALSLFDVTTSLLDEAGGRIWEIVYTPTEPRTLDNGQWRLDILPKIGTYTVTLDAADGAARKSVWSLASQADNNPDTTAPWATLEAFPGSVLSQVYALREAAGDIWAKYPQDATHNDFSREDYAAYDTLHREAGFYGYTRALPQPGELSLEEARNAAFGALLAEIPEAAPALEDGSITVEYHLLEDGPTWLISVYYAAEDGVEINYFASVDAQSGVVLMTEASSGGNG